MSTEGILSQLITLCRQVRNNAELGLAVSMRTLNQQLFTIASQIRRQDFPSEISYHVDGLLRYMSSNMDPSSNLNSRQWRFVRQGLQTLENKISELEYQMNKYVKGTAYGRTLKKTTVFPEAHYSAVSACDFSKNNKVYQDINQQQRDAEHVFQNRHNLYYDDSWISAVTPKGQTAYEYEVERGYADPLDLSCLEGITRGRKQMSIPNEMFWNNPEPENQKDMRFPRIAVPMVVRNDESINDWNGRLRYNESRSYGSFRY